MGFNSGFKGLNTMATTVGRALLCILSKDALDVMWNIEVLFVRVFRARNAQYFSIKFSTDVTYTNSCMLCC